MTEHTEEDFKSARFAVLPKYGLCAHRSVGEFYWQRDGIKRATNAEMAEAGWRPVVEAEDPEAIVALIGRQAMRIRELDAEADGAISLDGLRAAWENAERADECRAGDTLIEFFAHGAYHVYSASADYSSLPMAVRVLSRAPQPEPWADLADVLAVEMPGIEDEPRIEALAKALYCEHGVRVKGGDEA